MSEIDSSLSGFLVHNFFFLITIIIPITITNTMMIIITITIIITFEFDLLEDSLFGNWGKVLGVEIKVVDDDDDGVVKYVFDDDSVVDDIVGSETIFLIKFESNIPTSQENCFW